MRKRRGCVLTLYFPRHILPADSQRGTGCFLKNKEGGSDGSRDDEV